MKRIFLIAVILFSFVFVNAQTSNEALKALVAKLDQANTANDYKALGNAFEKIATAQKSDWLSWYYAALCNAKAGWLKENDPDNIEPLTDKSEQQITKARALIDTAANRKALSEIFCVLSMLNRARVFINPQTYGRQYGPRSSQYIKLAQSADPDNPRAIYLAGWEKFATPKAWGGDKAKAKELLLTAKNKLSGESSSDVSPHWGRKEIEELLSKVE